MSYARIRDALAKRGLTPAAWIPPASAGRAEEATIRPARLLEGSELAWHDPGAAEAWDETVAFLDGTQRSEVIGYAGAAPIVVAEIAAAVRERRDRRLSTVVERRRHVAFGRADALEAAGDALGDLERQPLDLPDAPHPVRDLNALSRALDAARGALEVAAGTGYRERSDGWLVVDGSLAESPAWAADPRMVGVAKSHATLPFDGADLERYLRLPAGRRSSLFEPQSRSVAPVAAWALRLWPWEGKDLFHGFVRVEVAPANANPEAADRISRRLLAERAPVSTPDPRWDRLLYGVHAVEAYLKVRGRK